MEKGRIAIGLALLVVVVAGGGIARAQFPQPYVVADATKRGHIDFYVAGERGARMTVSELVEGKKTAEIGSVVLDEHGHGVIRDGARWRCDRLSRRFGVEGMVGGTLTKNTYGVRTPACRDRFEVGLPRRTQPRRAVRMVIRDEWGIGDVRLRLCKLERGDRRRCRYIRLRKDTRRVVTSFRLHRLGRARIRLTGVGVNVLRWVAVGSEAVSEDRAARGPRLLAVGDSMMQGIDAFLADRLAKRARVFRDVHPNTGISKPGFDWVQRARDVTARVRPDVSVVFLGGNEGFALRSGAGLVACCGPVWFAEFASRVRSMMITYGRAGRKDVFWLIVPAPRSVERQEMQSVVSAAVRRAAQGIPRVRIVSLDEVFTPGGVYRDVMSYGGRRVRVRESDGIHFSLEGARIAADKVVAALKAARVIR